MREVKTCHRCRLFKRRCDLLKPSCSRCLQAGVRCSFHAEAVDPSSASVSTSDPVAASASAPATSSPASSSPASSALPAPVSAAEARSIASTTLSFLPINATNRHAGPSPPATAASAAGSPAASTPASTVLNPASAAATSTPSTLDEEAPSAAAAAAVGVRLGLVSPASSVESSEPQTAKSSDSVAAAPSCAPAAPAPPPGQRLIRKRKRNCLSCLRCHRLKVKCDKELPCSRCKSSGNGRECYYTFNKGPNGGKFPCPAPQAVKSAEQTKTVLATWQVQHKVRGSSHWRDLMTKIGSLTRTDSRSLTAALEDVATTACLANFTLPGNFPFGTPGATKYFPRDAVNRLLAGERANVAGYIEAYVELLDVVNPILDVDIFRQEVDRYWLEPHDANPCWLSQLLMVLGLGCFVARDESPVATELMMAAEACLMQTPFSFRPTLLSLKTMALMVVAKQVCNATCWSVDSCWSFLGVLVRTAFIYGLPQDASSGGDPTQSPEENDARKKLWLTILYLDVKVAMCTGMPPLTRPDELAGLAEAVPETWSAADPLPLVLYQSLPTVLAVMARVNTHGGGQMAYADVLRHNGQIRELMARAQRACPDPLQRITVDIFLRRCLMVLHRPFALHDEGPVLFPESYWSSLECCITLLMSYRDMWSGESPKRLDLLGRAYVLDFFSGSLTTYIHILREDAPLAGAESMGCVIPPKQLILELLRDCVDMWSPEKDRSVCYRTGYNLLEIVLNMLPKNGALPSEQSE